MASDNQNLVAILNDEGAGATSSTDSPGQSQDIETCYKAPDSLIGAAHEFRMQAKLSASPFAHYFFCRICGSPAGNDMFSCKYAGHSFCTLCTEELELERCPCPFKHEGKTYSCDAPLLKFKSLFREFLNKNTQVSCVNKDKGCEVEGLWEEVKEHLEKCDFNST